MRSTCGKCTRKAMYNRFFLRYIDIDGEKVKKRILPVDDSVTLINRSGVEVQSVC